MDAVRLYPVPRTATEVRRFLELCSFYRKFISNFAKTAQPLHRLTCKDSLFRWSPECQQAFEELKERLTTPPLLAYPDFEHDFVLETDASVQGIGAVLSQYQQTGGLRPVSYASQALSIAEKR